MPQAWHPQFHSCSASLTKEWRLNCAWRKTDQCLERWIIISFHHPAWGLILSSLLLLVWWGFFSRGVWEIGKSPSETPEVAQSFLLLRGCQELGMAENQECQEAGNGRKPIAMPTPATSLPFIAPGWLFSLQLQYRQEMLMLTGFT